MKIYCNLDLDARSFEGRTQLSRVIVDALKNKGYHFTSNPQEADLFHFHSSGIAESRKAFHFKQQYHKPTLYSLYSTAQTSLLMHPVNFFLQWKHFQKTATQFLPSYSAALPLYWRSYYLNRLDAVIVPSLYLKQHFPNGRVIPFGVDISRFRPVAGIPEKKAGRIKVAYVGHPGVFKGLNDFVQGSTLFHPSIEPHVFLTQRFAKVDDYIVKRNSKITIHGFHEDMATVYTQMDIIVLPYRSEIGTVANPLVLLEAMACGKPVVTTDFPFIREIVEGAALVTKRFSPLSVANAVNMLAVSPSQCAELGSKARQRIEERYTTKAMIDEYLRLYEHYEQA